MRKLGFGVWMLAIAASGGCATLPPQVGLDPLSEADRTASTAPFPVVLPKPAQMDTPPRDAVGPLGPLQTLPAWMRAPGPRTPSVADAPRAAGPIPFPNAPIAAAPPPAAQQPAAPTPVEHAAMREPAPAAPVAPAAAPPTTAPPMTAPDGCEIEVLDGWVNAMPPGPPRLIVVGEIWPPAGAEGVFVRNVRVDGRSPVTVILELDARRVASDRAPRRPEPFRFEEPARDDLATVEIVCEGRTLGRLRDVPRAY